LHGYASDMEGTKALFLEKVCDELGLGFVRFDCSGHGKSSGKLTEATLSQWILEAKAVIAHTIGDEKFILVGSSMGGWLMLLLAQHPNLCGMIGIAVAPNFSEDLMWNTFSSAQKNLLQTKGELTIDNSYGSYKVSMKFIKDASNHLINFDDLVISVPTHFLHGMDDEDVPYEFSIRLGNAIKNNSNVSLVKDANHRFSRPEDLALLKNSLLVMIASSPAI